MPYPNAVPLPEDLYTEPVVFEVAEENRSEQGAVLYDWPAGEPRPMWASVQPKDVQRVDSGGRLTVKSMTVVHTAEDPQARPHDRFLWDGKTLVVDGGSRDDGSGLNYITECNEYD